MCTLSNLTHFFVVAEILVRHGHIFSSRYPAFADVCVMAVGHKTLHMHFQMNVRA